MRHGSLFSGIGGFDLAAQWMGWENIFSCEINPFGQKVLKYYWPNAIHYEDINKTDFTIHRGGIDILTGGFPCQPFSQAGKRKGTADDRHLWPRMLEVIREVQPVWVVGENVYGIVNWDGGLVFDQVQADLESEGYEVQPVILPACGVNAPHKRDRIWFVAKNTRGNGCRNGKYEKQGNIGNVREFMSGSKERNFGEKVEGTSPNSSNPGTKGVQQRENRILSDKITSDPGLLRSEISKEQTAGIEQCDERDVADTCNKGLQRSKDNRNTGESGKDGNKQSSGLFCPDWQNFPTQSPLCGRDDGVSYGLDGITFPKWRNESIKSYGNAIVPQVVFQIFKAIEEYEFSLFKNKS